MQTTERPPTGPSRNQSPARGVVLVVVAVVIGFFVLRAMDNTSADVGVVTAEPGTTATTAAGAAGGKASNTTAAKPAARAPAQVTVLVANASGVKGAAAKQTDKFKVAGYKTGAAANAPQGLDLAETQIMAVAGYQADAAKLAKDLGKPGAVKPMANPPPVPLAGANILVLLGSDLAG
jgi:hypothetical protein